MIELVEKVSHILDEWLAAPPKPCGVNAWVKSRQGSVYLRYVSAWNQIDIASIEIVKAQRRKGIARAIIECAVAKPVKCVLIENILTPRWARAVRIYAFDGYKTEVETHERAVTVKFVRRAAVVPASRHRVRPKGGSSMAVKMKTAKAEVAGFTDASSDKAQRRVKKFVLGVRARRKAAKKAEEAASLATESSDALVKASG